MKRKHVQLALMGTWLASSALAAACTGPAGPPCTDPTTVFIHVNSDLAASNLVVEGGCTSATCAVKNDSGGCVQWAAIWPVATATTAPPCVLTLELADGGRVSSALERFVCGRSIEAGF